jgi:hypothetical protein
MPSTIANAEPAIARDARPSAGYASGAYAAALAEFGVPLELPRSGSWLLMRPIPDGNLLCDCMGCYPLFSCRDWSTLGDDLAALADRDSQLVCASLVTDPFADVTAGQLAAALPDVCYQYKQHYVTDLSLPLEGRIPSHHRRNVRKALASIEVRDSTDDDALALWPALYQSLIERHAIAGIARFSPRSFALQACVPGFAAFSAWHGGELCGMTLWYVRGDVADYHLAAYTAQGYELSASYALFWTALGHFAKLGVGWAALGAGAGTTAAASGLTRFKQGWATETRPVYFGGRILNNAAYRRLTADVPPGLNYFPAYRRP